MINLSIRLALSNLYKNKQTYIPYLITCILSVAMFYVINSLTLNPNLETMFGGATMQSILGLGVFVIAFFSVIFLFYSHSFLIKKRQKEFGLYHVLGMEKRHVGLIVFFESLFEALLSIFLGLVFGTLLDKLMFLILARLFEKNAPLGFYLSFEAIRGTVLLFSIIFMMILVRSLWIVKRSRPLALLASDKVGEKEPKSSLIITLLGTICLLTGYYIALTVKNPLMALNLFFVAVILVMIGTYCLFMSGSIFLLKILKRNKKYYYTKNHMISVSSLLYRMKRHALGLANICILSTMVLVMLCSTVSLWIGSEDLLMTRYPYDIVLEESFSMDDVEHLSADLKKQFKLEDETSYEYITLTAINQDGVFDLDATDFSYDAMSRVANLFIITQDDYNRNFEKDLQLADDEVYIFDQNDSYNEQSMTIASNHYRIKGELDDFVDNGLARALTVDTYGIVVSGGDVLKQLAMLQPYLADDSDYYTKGYYGFNVEGDSVIVKDYIEKNYDFNYVECREVHRLDFISLYGGLLFLGIFLSILFMMASTLIIYYKQLIEGYEDQDKYEILQKVGMDQEMVKKTIKSQVRLFFFLPLIAAFVHIGFAFNIIDRLLKCLMLDNTLLFIYCTLGCMAIYGLIYYCIYCMTSKLYYRIVKRS